MCWNFRANCAVLGRPREGGSCALAQGRWQALHVSAWALAEHASYLY